ncbi:MAG TPA: FtsX-like permease family protein [Microbacteriaceae bacterium]|nr:FtsX-like permease family protein [Microbacteriaceae bacterium]
MWRLSLQMFRGNLRRFVGAILAGFLASGFFATVLLFIALINAATEQSMGSAAEDNEVGAQAILGFVAIGLIVAGSVVFTTFSVIVTQRTSELALMRCLGASRNQVRRSIVREAFGLGVISSVLGDAVALLCATVVAGVNHVPFVVPPAALLWPIIITTLLFIGAALVPARAATRVAPLAALRPLSSGIADRRGSRVRLALGAVIAIAGLSLLVFGAIAPSNLVGISALGGLSVAVGVMLTGLWLIPALVVAVGRMFGSKRIALTLARLNATRQPRRLASTANAFIVGISLVAMIQSGMLVANTRLENWVFATAAEQGFDPNETIVQVRESLAAVANIVSALLAVAVLVAIVGISNTTALSVSERSRENALLRALGLSRGKLRAALLAEALLVSTCAALIGIVLGWLLGTFGVNALLNTYLGSFALVVPWAAIAALLGIAVAAGILATLLPARRATRLSPVAALAYE